MPSDDGHQAIAPLLCWSEGEGGWRGPAPKDHLEAYCAGHKVRVGRVWHCMMRDVPEM